MISAALVPVNPLSVVGILLTLASLLGTFFYVHLSQWLRDLAALDRKYDLNQLKGTEPEKRAIVECKVELKRLDAWPNYFVNLIVFAFVVFIIIIALQLTDAARTDPSQPTVYLALWVFGIVFTILSVALFLIGWQSAANLKKRLV